ncbi:hypothetical protein B0H17DRAFT_1190700 [Mycena rosella]|uniref:MYND-type domain-containing protein n=1 Tax=Mycena rosella TaxID=1033263 RepID=A0AAD7H0H1_MYCRO|nr:hypothetical protein B0H17DRAFT_1190700 [Mycena rosella]
MLISGPTTNLTAAIPAHLKAALQAYSVDPGDSDAGKDLSYLHLAVLQGDLPLAHESLRLGSSIHCKDKQGYSPLFYGVNMLSNVMRNGKFNSDIPLGPAYASQAEKEDYLARMVAVCLFFVSHHSDPNETHGTNITVLALACIIGSWDLIRALLLHGANPHGLPTARIFKDDATRTRFESLVRELSTAVRPARICPCGSGRPLKDCHINSQPYPPSCICPCESRKLYSACCAKKPDISFDMIWSEEKDWLDARPSITRHVNALDVERMFRGMGIAGIAGADVDGPLTKESYRWFDKPNSVILEDLSKKRQIDPAYVAACKKTMVTPSPTALRAVPKPNCIKMAKQWNIAVDTYIASGVDLRASGIIEAAAKIGPAGGPLYRKCEAAGCAKIEGSDSANAFPYCSGCKTTVYCSHDCQKSAWKTHKSACRAGNVEAQMLSSQEAYAAELARMVGFKFT